MPPAVVATVSALEKYRAEVSANPRSAEAHANLGWGHYGLGQVMEAQKAFQEALDLAPDLLEARYGLALVHKAAGAKTDALTTFNAALALAGRLDDRVRGAMLQRLIRGHINMIQTGDWNLGRPEQHA